MIQDPITVDIENMPHDKPITSLFTNNQSLSEKQRIILNSSRIVTEVFTNYYTGPNFHNKTDEDREQVAHMNRAFIRLFELLNQGFMQESIVCEAVSVPLEFNEFIQDIFCLLEANELLNDIFDYYFESDASSGSDFSDYSEVKWFLYTTIKLSFEALNMHNDEVEDEKVLSFLQGDEPWNPGKEVL
jgi:hypothetical protein